MPCWGTVHASRSEMRMKPTRIKAVLFCLVVPLALALLLWIDRAAGLGLRDKPSLLLLGGIITVAVATILVFGSIFLAVWVADKPPRKDEPK
jgi:hypothetical protein